MHKAVRLSLLSQKISPPCHCLSLAPPPSSGTAPNNSFDDVTGKIVKDLEGFVHFGCIWKPLCIKENIH